MAHLSDQPLGTSLVGASERLDQAVAERKANPLVASGDFASQSRRFISKETGRQDWHIECSVMATST